MPTPTPKQVQFLDIHHGGDPDWNSFARRLQHPSFVQAVIEHGGSDPKLRRFARAMHGLKKGDTLARVKGTLGGKRYQIKRMPTGRVGCTCNDWRYKKSVTGGDCKHVRAWKAQHMQTKQAAFIDELEKLAKESKPWQDFLAGIDPTGTKTFQFGLKNVDKHRQHQALGVTGGFLGGATVVPSAIMGLVGGIKGGLVTPGGAQARARGVASGAWAGMKKPVLGTVDALRAQRLLSRTAKSGVFEGTESNQRLLKRVADDVPLGAIRDGAPELERSAERILKATKSSDLSGSLQAAREAQKLSRGLGPDDARALLELSRLKPGESVRLSESMKSSLDRASGVAHRQVSEGVAILSLGGLVNSLSAGMQYQHARETAEAHGLNR